MDMANASIDLSKFEAKARRTFNDPLQAHYTQGAEHLRKIHEKQSNLAKLNDLRCYSPFGRLVYEAVVLALAHGKEIEYLIEKYKLLHGVIPINPWILKIVLAEVLWGKNQRVKAQAPEITAISHFEETLRESYPELLTVIKNPLYIKKVKIPTYVRINTLSISLEDSIAAFHKEGWKILPSCDTYQEYLSVVSNLSGDNFIKDYHVPDLLVFPCGTSFYKHPGCLRGKFLLQDKGSCLSSFLLNPKPNSAVVDMCAAPGLKLNHLANIMGDTGVIYATDHHFDRWTNLEELLKLTNVTCAKTLNAEYDRGSLEDEAAKYILLDHTTTNSGLFYYILASNKKLPLPNIQVSTSKLYEALRFALHKYPNAKRVVFTTCTIYAEEAEMVVDKVLNTIGDSYTLLDVKEMLWNQWSSMAYPGYRCSSKCLRTSPEVDFCYSYFIAVFERNFNVPLPPYVHKSLYRAEYGGNRGLNDEVQEIPSHSANNVQFNSKPPAKYVLPNGAVSSKKKFKKFKRLEQRLALKEEKKLMRQKGNKKGARGAT
ncbi:hypothetical protein QAD02_018866 [Eretmocerus hayati]|uniref:Uncharacterized protein n=1 Tax=Eretmocerus hayati TaxID=131215 RepID=A0ACC2PKH2_9HYME|nr:hypothetical protein QAD02_018866 [Eretmocerus hayati]